MYSFFVGCDMSKDFFDVSFCKETKAIYLGQFPNTIDGFAEVIQLLGSQTTAPLSEWFVCFENTGIYSKSLLEWLISQRIACREEFPSRFHARLVFGEEKAIKWILKIYASTLLKKEIQ